MLFIALVVFLLNPVADMDFIGFSVTTTLGTFSNCGIIATGAALLHDALGCTQPGFASASLAYGAVATAFGAVQLVTGLSLMVTYREAFKMVLAYVRGHEQLFPNV